MTTANDEVDPKVEALWRDVIENGHRSRLAVLPSHARCSMCSVPFDGIGGPIVRLAGHKPSRKNPTLCNL
jgi:adenylate cyclase